MKLISMELHNFRKFRHAEINFPEGIMGLVGNNGAGKSTIIEAIGWAIYGNKAARTKRDMIKRQGASPGDECWVKLVFEMGGNVYEVFRMITKNSTDARVKVNGRIAASTTQGATEYLEKMLGMDYDSFYTSIVARQQELNALSNKSPGERKKSMMKMLGIDILDDAIKRVREDRRLLEKNVEYMEKNLKDMDEMEREKEEMEREKNGYIKRKEELLRKKERAEERRKRAEERRKREREKAERFKELDERIKVLKDRRELKKGIAVRKEEEINELQRREEEYNRLKIYVKEYENLRDEKEEMERARKNYMERKNMEENLMALEKESREIEETIRELERKAEKKDVEKELDRVKEKRKKLQEKIRETERIVERIDVEISSINSRKEEMRKKMDEMENLGPDSNCPTCGRPLGDVYEKILKEYEEEISKMDAIMEEMKEQQREKRKEMEAIKREEAEAEENEKELQRIVMEYGKIMERIKSFKERKEEIEGKRKVIEEKIASLEKFEFDEDTYEKLVSELKRVERLKDRAISLEGEVKKIPALHEELKNLRNEIKEIENEIEKYEKEIELLDFVPEEYEKAEREYDEAVEILNSINVEITRMEGKIETMEREIKRISREIDEQRKMRKEIKDMRRKIALLETLAGDRDTGLLNNFKNYLISKIGPLLSHYASHFLSLFTDGKYREIEIDENYNILIYDRGEKFELGRFSGGEKDVANLSLRLAISELIVQRSDIIFEFIALDEIFGSQDRERRKNILNALAELKKQFRQIILITHIDEIKEAMEHIIRVYEDEEGISHVSVE